MDAEISEPVVSRQEISDVVRQAEVIHGTGDKSRCVGNSISEPGERQEVAKGKLGQ